MILTATVCLILGIILGICIGISPRHSLQQKNIGEALVADTICNICSKPFHLINNVTLSTSNGATQIDHILISQQGIFVIETKHYSGWIFGSPKSKNWTQTIYRYKKSFKNPIHQNFGHIQELKLLFNLSDDHFKSLVVFSGSGEIRTDLGPDVIPISHLSDYLDRLRKPILDERKIAYIVGRIEMSRMQRSVETDEYHLNAIAERQRNVA